MANFNTLRFNNIKSKEKQRICTFNCASQIHRYRNEADWTEFNMAAADSDIVCCWAATAQSQNLKHYENMPIQINWKFHLQKMKIFR